MSSKNKIIGLIVSLALILIAVFSLGLYSKNNAPSLPPEIKTKTEDPTGVKVVSTNPESLEGKTIAPTQTLEITFNKPLVRDDTRIVLEPKASYTTDLSSDHKTLKIIPNKAFELGKDYTLTIKSGYGTDTGEKLDTDVIFRFKTITYTGV